MNSVETSSIVHFQFWIDFIAYYDHLQFFLLLFCFFLFFLFSIYLDIPITVNERENCNFNEGENSSNLPVFASGLSNFEQ